MSHLRLVGISNHFITFLSLFLQNLLQVCERIPTIATQLKILSTVKATRAATEDDLYLSATRRLESFLGEGVTGDVVWSPSMQQGYLRFEGLAANNPLKERFQLWIFDANRPDATPVDGGVFDVQGDGTVVVAIDPKLPIGAVSAFAVTVERPEGVVVSDRTRLALLAAK